MIAATAAFVAVAGLGIAVPQPWPTQIVLALIMDFVAFGAYASFTFLQAAARTRAGTQRGCRPWRWAQPDRGRHCAGRLSLAFAEPPEWIGVTSQVLSLAAVVAYFVGFAPPAILQRGWQERAIRSALARAPEMVRLADPHDIGAEIAAAALEATGAQGSAVGLWDDRPGCCSSASLTGRSNPWRPARRSADGRSPCSARWSPAAPNATHRSGPMNTGAPASGPSSRRPSPAAIGGSAVLTVYAERPPVFTDDAVAVVGMLAEEAALVLRSQELLREAAQVRAMVEMTRLKDNFLSVVAHDVRTALTTILINSELLQNALDGDSRNAQRAGALRTEAERLKVLVDDYLDIVSAGAGGGTHGSRRRLVRRLSRWPCPAPSAWEQPRARLGGYRPARGAAAFGGLAGRRGPARLGGRRPVYQGEAGLVADRVEAPDLRDVDVVFGRQAPGDVDATGRNVEMKRRPGPAKVGPLGHRLEVVDRFGGFDLDRSHQLLAAIDGRQHQVGKNLHLADAHWNRLILADIRHDVVLALQLDQQETDDTVVLQLFANRSDQNWAHFSSAPDSTLNQAFMKTGKLLAGCQSV